MCCKLRRPKELSGCRTTSFLLIVGSRLWRFDMPIWRVDQHVNVPSCRKTAQELPSYSVWSQTWICRHSIETLVPDSENPLDVVGLNCSLPINSSPIESADSSSYHRLGER